MRDLALELVSRLESGQRLALGVLVHSQGSTPQRPGAKALFLSDGGVVGTLGGGCLEMEARRRALEALRTGRPQLVDIRLDSDYGFDDGLICGGIARVLIDPAPERSLDAWRELAECLEQESGAVLVTRLPADPEAEAPSRCLLTAKELALPEGPEVLPKDLLRAALGSLETSLPTLVTVEREGGAETYYLEPYPRRPTLLIAGAGHVGQALARIASGLEFRVVVIDDRAAFANRGRFPEADELVVDDIPSALRSYPIAGDTYVVIVTRGHRHDGQALQESLRRGARYVGMIGSRRKIRIIYEDLVAEGRADWEELQSVHAPIGLDIGAISVEEIAVAIAAELILVRRRGESGLRDSAGRRQVPTYGALQATAPLRRPNGGGEGGGRPSRCPG